MDHLDTAGLRAKYGTDVNLRVDDIVDVRYVHQGGPLADTVGGARFDYVVASHVAEHMPDLIGWLQQLAVVLRPGGVVSLAVPDKRFSFDCLRHNSDIVDVVEAYLDRQQRPSFRQVLDYHYYISQAGEGDWLARLSADPGLASQVPRTLPHLLPSLGMEGLARYHQALPAEVAASPDREARKRLIHESLPVLGGG